MPVHNAGAIPKSSSRSPHLPRSRAAAASSDRDRLEALLFAEPDTDSDVDTKENATQKAHLKKEAGAAKCGAHDLKCQIPASASHPPGPRVLLVTLRCFVYALYKSRCSPVEQSVDVELQVAESMLQEGSDDPLDTTHAHPHKIRAALQQCTLQPLFDSIRAQTDDLKHFHLFFASTPLRPDQLLLEACPTLWTKISTKWSRLGAESVALPLSAPAPLFLTAVPQSKEQASCACEGCRNKQVAAATRVVKTHTKQIFQMHSARRLALHQHKQQQQQQQQRESESRKQTAGQQQDAHAEPSCVVRDAISPHADAALAPPECTDAACAASACAETVCCPDLICSDAACAVSTCTDPSCVESDSTDCSICDADEYTSAACTSNEECAECAVVPSAPVCAPCKECADLRVSPLLLPQTSRSVRARTAATSYSNECCSFFAPPTCRPQHHHGARRIACSSTPASECLTCLSMLQQFHAHACDSTAHSAADEPLGSSDDPCNAPNRDEAATCDQATCMGEADPDIPVLSLEESSLGEADELRATSPSPDVKIEPTAGEDAFVSSVPDTVEISPGALSVSITPVGTATHRAPHIQSPSAESADQDAVWLQQHATQSPTDSPTLSAVHTSPPSPPCAAPCVCSGCAVLAAELADLRNALFSLRNEMASSIAQLKLDLFMAQQSGQMQVATVQRGASGAPRQTTAAQMSCKKQRQSTLSAAQPTAVSTQKANKCAFHLPRFLDGDTNADRITAGADPMSQASTALADRGHISTTPTRGLKAPLTQRHAEPGAHAGVARDVPALQSKHVLHDECFAVWREHHHQQHPQCHIDSANPHSNHQHWPHAGEAVTAASLHTSHSHPRQHTQAHECGSATPSAWAHHFHSDGSLMGGKARHAHAHATFFEMVRLM